MAVREPRWDTMDATEQREAVTKTVRAELERENNSWREATKRELTSTLYAEAAEKWNRAELAWKRILGALGILAGAALLCIGIWALWDYNAVTIPASDAETASWRGSCLTTGGQVFKTTDYRASYVCITGGKVVSTHE